MSKRRRLSDASETSESATADGAQENDASGPKTTFKALGVVDTLCEACTNMGWTAPTPIQREAIPMALQKRDIIGIAETGSGKTGAFAIPVIQALLENPKPLFALVLSPTRELAQQIAAAFEALGSLISLRVCLVVGGLDMVSQAIALGRKPHVIVATPGRLVDHLERTKGFSLRTLQYLIMDEADRILDLDFGPAMDKILKFLPRERHTYLFSATMSSKVESLQRASLHDPVRVSVSASKYATVATLTQRYLFIPLAKKDVYLIYLMNEFAGKPTIVFTRTVNETQRLTIMLRLMGFKAVPLHGQLDQTKRLAALNKFKAKESDILCATDVAARGLDLPAVSLVLNYDLPTDSASYVHRVGRTARAGKTGQAISMITQYDVELYQRIEAALGQKLKEYPTEKDEVEVFHARVEEAQREAKIEMKKLHEDRGKRGAVLKGRRPAKHVKRSRDDMDAEEG